MGGEEREKRLKDTYGSEADALAAARSERQRVERGKATFELTLGYGLIRSIGFISLKPVQWNLPNKANCSGNTF